MSYLPDEHELIGFFEAEPHVLDPEVPWAYNTLTFCTQRNSDEVTCVLIPGYEELKLEWKRSGVVVAKLHLTGLITMELKRRGEEELLIADFRDSKLRDFKLWLKPHVAIEWGNSYQ
jgi:hypothetical protein